VAAPEASPGIAGPSEEPVPVAASALELSQRAFPSADLASDPVLNDVGVVDAPEDQPPTAAGAGDRRRRDLPPHILTSSPPS